MEPIWKSNISGSPRPPIDKFKSVEPAGRPLCHRVGADNSRPICRYFPSRKKAALGHDNGQIIATRNQRPVLWINVFIFLIRKLSVVRMHADGDSWIHKMALLFCTFTFFFLWPDDESKIVPAS